MKRAIVFGISFAILVYTILFVYAFVISPPLKEKSASKWIENEKKKEIKFMGINVCKECHYEVYQKLIAGNHSTVSCEACHGVGREHALTRSPESVEIKKEESWELCLKCHVEIPANKAVETITPEHAKGVYCVVCHDAHK